LGHLEPSAVAPQFSAISIGPLAKDPVPPELTRRRGDHTIIIGIRPERPSSSVRPRIGISRKRTREKEIGEAPPSRLEPVGLLAERVARLRLARARGKSAP